MEYYGYLDTKFANFHGCEFEGCVSCDGRTYGSYQLKTY